MCEKLGALEAFNELKEGHWFDFADAYFYLNPQLKIDLCVVEATLKTLKTLNDEFGIDLIVLFKTKTVWCKTLVENIKTKELSYQIIDRKLWGVNLEDKEIMVGSSSRFSSHKIKDYGKTWALTKEELL